ncbi:hypothetical protein RSO41_08340 [Halomonas sp. I1]|uniref:hypothetical protein n=1 Tax=Halomonas sp. I1 TaxID=393536 RepID=UPI0028DDE253|nr:hypothetical protein [Halomonas sp. I1]MDT8894666.1 hypothetical protein [Halomonas sp. I1]
MTITDSGDDAYIDHAGQPSPTAWLFIIAPASFIKSTPGIEPSPDSDDGNGANNETTTGSDMITSPCLRRASVENAFTPCRDNHHAG